MNRKVSRALRAAKYQTGGYVDPMGNVAYSEGQNTAAVPSIPVDERVRQYLRGVKQKQNPNMIAGVGLPQSERDYLYPDDTREPSTFERIMASPQGQQLNFLANFIGPGPKAPRPGIRAYHGSPHDFDRFDMSKIGTGEGAQAFGHGLYFAENESVAKAYRDALSQDALGVVARGRLRQFEGDIDKALEYMRGNNRPNEAEALSQLKAVKAQGMKSGRMYEVNINVDPEDFLDWDKPISQQSDKVRVALHKKIDQSAAEADAAGHGWAKSAWEALQGPSDLDGDVFLRAVGDRLTRDPKTGEGIGGHFNDKGHPSPQLASKFLNDANIPGVRYLDQGSRPAGRGSRNYVLFRDDIIDIVRKYGMTAAVSMYGADAVTNAMQDQ